MSDREKEIERLQILFEMISELERKADKIITTLELLPMDLAKLKHEALNQQ